MQIHTSNATRHILLPTIFLVSTFTSVALVQKPNDRYPKTPKPAPATIQTAIFAIPENAVQQQWPSTLDLINAPADLKQVEPGQCVRFGVAATGDHRDELLRDAKYSFEVRVGGKTQNFPPQPLMAMKRIKPEGGDFVTEALSSAGIQNPMESLASLAASQAHWCAATDTTDGILTVEGEVTTANGKKVHLPARTIDVKTFATARKTPPFKDINGLSRWIQRYYFAPDPAQLLPAFRTVAADKQDRGLENIAAFFVAALKASPAAAEDLSRQLALEDLNVQTYAIPLLAQAGYPVDRLLAGFDEGEKRQMLAAHLPDSYDMTPDRTLPNRMDMMWSTFFATGEIKPVRTIASFLAWRGDFENLQKMLHAGQKPTEITDSIMRAVSYGAAGWSLNAISRNDELVNDYIQYLEASPTTSAVEKKELAGIHTNPAFTMK